MAGTAYGPVLTTVDVELVVIIVIKTHWVGVKYEESKPLVG